MLLLCIFLNRRTYKPNVLFRQAMLDYLQKHLSAFKSTIPLLFFSIFLGQINTSSAACPQLINGLGAASSNPYWISCSGGNYNLCIESPTAIGSYTLDFGDGSGIVTGASLAANTCINHLYAATVDTFIVKLNTGGCSITGVVVMEEDPTPEIGIPGGVSLQICVPGSVQLINKTNNSSGKTISKTTTFTWDFGDGTPILNYDYTNANQTVSHTYQPNTVNCATNVILTAKNYCSIPGNPNTNTFGPIKIWDKDVAQITASPSTLCFPNNVVNYTNTTTRNCTTFGNTVQRYEYWNFGNYWGMGHDSIITWKAWPPSTPQNIAYPGLGTYTAMLIDSSYCGLDTAYTSITITTPPTAGVTTSPSTTICQGQTITFTNTSGGGANNYLINYGDGGGFVAMVAPPGTKTHTYTTAGTFTAKLVANIIPGTSACTDTASVVISVLPSPQANFSQNNTQFCDSGYVTFTDASVNAVLWNWTFANGNVDATSTPPVQFYASAPATYTVSLLVTGANGCTNTKRSTVKVFQSPNVSIAVSAVCTKSPAAFTDLSTHAAGDPITTWLWKFGDGSANSATQNPIHTYTVTGSYNVVLKVNTAFCTDVDSVTVTVKPLPTAAFTQDVLTGCTPLPVNYTDASSSAVGYTWKFGDGSANSATPSPSHTYINPSNNDTTYKVKLIVENSSGCYDSTSKNITVFHAAHAAYTDNATPSCSPLAVAFTNNSIGATGYSWNFGDSSPSSSLTNPSHTFVNTSIFIQNYSITLTIASVNGCYDSKTQSVSVYPESTYSITTSPGDTGCYSFNVGFTASSGGSVYSWIFGDGGTSSAQNPSHIFNNPGTADSIYHVRLVVTNPFFCYDTVYRNIVVHPQPVANFNPTSSLGCQPLSGVLNNTSTGATSYKWDFGDGSPESNDISPPHVFSNTTTAAITYTVTLYATSGAGCVSTKKKSIQVYPFLEAKLLSDSAGCSPLNINFQNQSVGAASYTWNFGDGNGSASVNPSHSYVNNSVNDTTYALTLIATSSYGCNDTLKKNIVVHPSPKAEFVALPFTQTYPNATVNYTNTTSNGNWQYSWNFGDGTTSTSQNPPAHNYATWGRYKILLTVSNAYCSDTLSQTIIINAPVPVAGFNPVDTTGCRPFTLTFTNTSKYATSFAWDFGDGSTSTETNPTHTYYDAGTFIVKLVVAGQGGQGNKQSEVTVQEKPVAFFTTSPQIVYIPNDPLLCFNLSQYADTYSWDFGDGDKSTDQNPQHYYSKEGTYDITLTATNQYGCTNTFTETSAVKAEAQGDITFPTAFTPNTSGPNGGSYNSNSYDNNVFFPFTKGVVQYDMQIYTRWGELIFETTDLNVGWDGYYKGKLCQQDVYVYKIVAKLADGKTVNKVGDVTLLR